MSQKDIGSEPPSSGVAHLRGYIVKERYNLTGARWSRDNTGNVLALRLAIANEEWELYWRPAPADQLEAA